LRTDLLDAGDKLALFRFFVEVGRANPHALADTSVREWLDLKVRRPQLRRVMTAVARTFAYTTALDLVSAEMFVEKLQRSLKHPRPLHRRRLAGSSWTGCGPRRRGPGPVSSATPTSRASRDPAAVREACACAAAVPCERPPSSWQQDPGTPRGWSTGEGTLRCAG
jgi:hypothetical protein